MIKLDLIKKETNVDRDNINQSNNDVSPQDNIPNQIEPTIHETKKHNNKIKIVIAAVLIIVLFSIAGFFVWNNEANNNVSQTNLKNEPAYKIVGSDLIKINTNGKETKILSNSKLVEILGYENNKLYLRYIDDNQNNTGYTIYDIGYLDASSNEPTQLKLLYRADDYYSGMIYIKDSNIFYVSSDGILIKYDTEKKQKIQITLNVEDIALNNRLLYYFTYNSGLAKSTLYSYNIDTNKIANLSTAPCRGVYTMVIYDNSIYYGVSGTTLTSSGYGVLKYNISTKETSLFLDKDLRYLRYGENFIKINNYFLYVDNEKNQLVKIDGNGKLEIVYTLDNKNNYLAEEIQLNSKNILRLDVGSFQGKSYGSQIGYIYLDIDNNFKVLQNIKFCNSILYI